MHFFTPSVYKTYEYAVLLQKNIKKQKTKIADF